jgi:hypothetical protein
MCISDSHATDSSEVNHPTIQLRCQDSAPVFRRQPFNDEIGFPIHFFMRPGSFGPVFMEAVVTGLGAAFLSYIVGTIYRRYRRKRVVA